MLVASPKSRRSGAEAEKSSRSFELCTATNSDFGHSEPSPASLASGAKRCDAMPPRSVPSSNRDFDIARYSLVFRTLRESARPPAEIDAAIPDAAALAPSPRRQKKIRKVVDTKKMRG